jgi:hypothetical protein
MTGVYEFLVKWYHVVEAKKLAFHGEWVVIKGHGLISHVKEGVPHYEILINSTIKCLGYGIKYHIPFEAEVISPN